MEDRITVCIQPRGNKIIHKTFGCLSVNTLPNLTNFVDGKASRAADVVNMSCKSHVFVHNDPKIPSRCLINNINNVLDRSVIDGVEELSVLKCDDIWNTSSRKSCLTRRQRICLTMDCNRHVLHFRGVLDGCTSLRDMSDVETRLWPNMSKWGWCRTMIKLRFC